MSAIFDFSSLITVFVLSICTTTYLRELRPAIFDSTTTSTSTSTASQQQHHQQAPSSLNSIDNDNLMTNNNNINKHNNHHHRDGMIGFLWKLSRIGERCSPYISIACILQAINILFWK